MDENKMQELNSRKQRKSMKLRFKKVNNTGDWKLFEIQPFLALVVTEQNPLYSKI